MSYPTYTVRARSCISLSLTRTHIPFTRYRAPLYLALPHYLSTFLSRGPTIKKALMTHLARGPLPSSRSFTAHSFSHTLGAFR